VIDYLLSVAALIGIYIVLATSYDLVLGYTGMLSIAHGAFYGIGAYATALLLLRLQWSFIPALVAACLLTGGIAALVAIPATRLSGDYLVVASLGFAVITYSLMLNLTDITRGSMGLPGIPGPDILGFPITGSAGRTAVIYGVVALCCLVAWRLGASPFGRVLRAIRDDPIAAEASGKNVFAYKVTVFALTGGLAGVAGGLYATYVRFIDPESFILDASFLILMAVILGGLGTFWGPLLGAAVIWALPETLRFLPLTPTVKGALNQVIYAILLILILLFRPQGLLGSLARPRGQRQTDSPSGSEPGWSLPSSSPSDLKQGQHKITTD
jgi:branched-chain amino acid transport system permease protein